MSQVFAPLFPNMDADLPLAALNPPADALEYLSDQRIPALMPLTAYRIEHPHSALVKRHDGDGRQDTLYTPAGRLTAKYVRADETAPWQRQSGFVRRGSQLSTLAAYLADMAAVPLPDSLLPQAGPSEVPVGWMLPSPLARMLEDWLEPGLSDSLLESGDGAKCLRLLDALFDAEAQSFSRHDLPLIAIDERLAAAPEKGTLENRHLRYCLRQLALACPDTALAVTVCGVLPLVSDEGILYLKYLADPRLHGAETVLSPLEAWREAPRPDVLFLLPSCGSAQYPPLIYQARARTRDT